jgi:hypothetical protein
MLLSLSPPLTESGEHQNLGSVSPQIGPLFVLDLHGRELGMAVFRAVRASRETSHVSWTWGAVKYMSRGTGLLTREVIINHVVRDNND